MNTNKVRARGDDPLAPLLRAVAEGSDPAFEELYERCRQKVFAYLFRTVGGDRMLAEDLLVETFVEVWKSAGRFEGRSRSMTWIIGIGRNLSMGALRKRCSQRTESLEDHPNLKADCGDGDESLGRKRLVRTVLKGLSEKHREVLELVFFEGFTYREIGMLLGIPENTVKTRVFYAKDALREELARKGVERDAI